MAAQQVDVWCHICNAAKTATFNDELQEYQCDECQSTFVEQSNQGIEEFIAGGEEEREAEGDEDEEQGNATQAQTASSADPTIQIINTVLNRFLGIPISNTSQLRFESSGSGRRPVGIIMQQATFEGNSALPIVGLLNSLASIRSGARSYNSNAMSDAQFEQFLHHILMNESSHSGAPPASEELIASLDKITVTEDSNKSELGECCISQDSFEIGDIVITLPCGHKYKEEPIVHWLKMHRTCPVCRIALEEVK